MAFPQLGNVAETVLAAPYESDLTFAATKTLAWNGRAKLSSSADGWLVLSNQGGTDAQTLRLLFGTTGATGVYLRWEQTRTFGILAGDSNSYGGIIGNALYLNAVNSYLFLDGLAGSTIIGGRATSPQSALSASRGSIIADNVAGDLYFKHAMTGANTGWMNLKEGLLSTTTVDLNVATKTTLYTVPTAKTAYITKFVVRDASTNLTTAVFGMGYDANATDVVAQALHAGLTGATLYEIIPPKIGALEGGAAAVLGVVASILQGAAATAVVDTYGYLV